MSDVEQDFETVRNAAYDMNCACTDGTLEPGVECSTHAALSRIREAWEEADAACVEGLGWAKAKRAEVERLKGLVAAALTLDDAITATLDAGPEANARTNAATQAFRDAVAVYRALAPVEEESE